MHFLKVSSYVFIVLFMVMSLYQPLHCPLELSDLISQPVFQSIHIHGTFFKYKTVPWFLGAVQNWKAIPHQMTDASLTIIAPEFQRKNWFSWVEIVREVCSLTHLTTNIEDLFYPRHYTESWGSKTGWDRWLGRTFSYFLLQRFCKSIDLALC